MASDASGYSTYMCVAASPSSASLTTSKGWSSGVSNGKGDEVGLTGAATSCTATSTGGNLSVVIEGADSYSAGFTSSDTAGTSLEQTKSTVTYSITQANSLALIGIACDSVYDTCPQIAVPSGCTLMQRASYDGAENAIIYQCANQQPGNYTVSTGNLRSAVIAAYVFKPILTVTTTATTTISAPKLKSSFTETGLPWGSIFTVTYDNMSNAATVTSSNARVALDHLRAPGHL